MRLNGGIVIPEIAIWFSVQQESDILFYKVEKINYSKLIPHELQGVRGPELLYLIPLYPFIGMTINTPPQAMAYMNKLIYFVGLS